jgi:hypothetical protein
MGFGTSDVDDEALVPIILRASLAVDRYCAVPMTPDRYSFRGGTVTDEEHRFDLGDGLGALPTQTIWPRSYPLRSVSQMRAYITNSQYVDFATSELFLTKRTINVTSITLTSVGFFGAIAMPIVGLANPVLRVSYAYGFSFTSTDEYLVNTEGSTYQAQNQFWDTDVDPVIKKNGVIITTGFTVDPVEGKVVMDVAQTEADVITATYTYPMPAEVSQATGITVAKYLSDREMVGRGMGGLEALRVGEISMERSRSRAVIATKSLDLPNDAMQLLGGLHFMTIR